MRKRSGHIIFAAIFISVLISGSVNTSYFLRAPMDFTPTKNMIVSILVGE